MTVTILVLIILGFLLWPLYYFYWSYRYNNQDEFEKKEKDFVRLRKEKSEKAFDEIQNKLKKEKRIFFKENEIHIINNIFFEGIDNKETHIFEFKASVPEIKIYENKKYLRTYKIEPKNSNPDLYGQFFHCEVRVNGNFSVQIEGVISKNIENYDNGEGILFQPFFLSNQNLKNEENFGRGMFARGLHYNGYISSGNTRLVCICDVCEKSISVEFFHAGFSEVQYFYSTNSMETLIVGYGEIENMPHQLQNEIDENILKEVEAKLPKTFDGSFKYYNSFCCPHCHSPFNNFEKYKEIRPYEYYVHFYLNKQPISFSKKNEQNS